MKIHTFIIDAFTAEAFKGNPAGVVLLDKELDATTMQLVAGEINLSETAFVVKHESKPSQFSIRYFTPTTEVPFCGHATLAASKLALHKLGLSKAEFTTYHQLKLSATVEGDSIAMMFPLYNTESYVPDNAVFEALGINNALNARFAKDLNMLLIEIGNNEELKALQPDFVKLLESGTFKNVIVTARSYDDQYDFYSRCFCPRIGINEDPVTGAAHSILAKYWGDMLGKRKMKAYQSSKRGGYMELSIVSDNQLKVRSNAQIILEGTIQI